MELKRTEGFIKEGIKMKKLLHRGFLGDTYDYKTVYDLEEAVGLTKQGWYFENTCNFLGNLSLFLWRDLKDIKSK